MNLNKSIPNTMFKPIKVIDIELSRPFTDIKCMHGYEFIQALIRLHGIPIGSAKIPLIDGYCSASVLSKIILKKHNQAIIRHLLHDKLMVPSQPGDLHISHLLDIPHAVYNGCLPLVTVAVCTRNRTDDLARCLDSLNHLNYPSLDILIVDNAPGDNSTEQLVRTRYPHMRYIHEPRPGLNWARNRTIVEARGEIIAYTDDDVVVDPGWIRALAEVFAEDSEVMAIVGLVVPYELETDAQILFEQYGGFGRGFERKWYQINRGNGTKVTSLYGHTGRFGTGANMAYRRILFDHIGSFDPALDVGTITNGGGDLEMFFRVLKEGYMLVYEPGAIVRHDHRRDLAQLREQIATWSTGFQSYLVRSALAYPDERFALIRLGLQKLCYGHIRYLILLLIRKIHKTPTVFLTELRGAEIRSALCGLFRYQKAHRIAAEITNVYGPIKQIRAPKRPIQKTTPHTSNAIAVRLIDINHPLHALTDIANYNHVRVFVTWNGNPLGTIDIANYRRPVGVTRLRDAIIDILGFKLLEPNYIQSLSPIQTPTLSTLTRLYSSTEDQKITMRTKLSSNVPVSIVVNTHGQSNELRDCLRCLVTQESSRHITITVMNNNASSDPAASIAAEFPNVTLVNEFRKGHTYACNKGFITNKGDIVIVIDDTVTMPSDWLEKLVAPFSRSDVMIVTGNVLPQELETSSQILFEKHFGSVRSFEPREIDGDWFKSFRRYAVPIWDIGTMTNVAFRTSIFNHPQINLTDETISTDIPIGCGAYSYIFYKVLKTGYTLMYEPSAFVWRKYPRDIPSLYRWLYHHSKGHVIYQLTTLIRDHDLRALPQLVIKIPEMHIFRFIKRLYGKNKYPLSFLMIESIGNLAGPFALLKSIRYGKHKDNNKSSLPISHVYQSEKGSSIGTPVFHTDKGSCRQMPAVSVIIPTYNRDQFLHSAIVSVLNQTYQNFEILVIDDNSKDNTQAVVKNFDDNRITYIRHEENKGEAGTRNTGIKHAKGTYIAFLDDDDEWLPEKLHLQVDLLQNSRPEVGCVYTGFLVVDKTKGKILHQIIPKKRGYIYYDMFVRNYIGTPSTVILKKECFERINLFDEHLAFGTDYDMWIRISKEFHVDYIKKPMVLYCKHEKGLSANLAVRNKGMETILKKYDQLFALNRRGHSQFYMFLGIYYCCSGDTPEGRKALLKAITLYPFQIRSYFNVGLSFLNTSTFIKLREFRMQGDRKLRLFLISVLRGIIYLRNFF